MCKGYKFVGWNKSVTNVSSNLEVVAHAFSKAAEEAIVNAGGTVVKL